MCTMSCEGPIDFGAGSGGYVNGRCSVITVASAQDQPGEKTSVSLEATPQRYSPMMSSTPGIGLTPRVTGFAVPDAVFVWNATFGQFLSWSPPDYVIRELGNTTMNQGKKVYWTFIEKPVSTKDPVTITVTARTARSGTVLGSSTVTLGWDGDYMVFVQDIR